MADSRDLSYEQLAALINDPAIRSFDRNMQEAEASIGIYLELRRRRGVMDSRELEEEHQDIIGVTKNALVASFSALDALIHAILQSQLPADDFEPLRYKTFQSSKHIASALKRLQIQGGTPSIAVKMSSDYYSPTDLMSTLDAFYSRKNHITHHADTDSTGNKIAFHPSYALSCVRFVRDFGHAFHTVTFRA